MLLDETLLLFILPEFEYKLTQVLLLVILLDESLLLTILLELDSK